jgi:hypothetical protein
MAPAPVGPKRAGFGSATLPETLHCNTIAKYFHKINSIQIPATMTWRILMILGHQSYYAGSATLDRKTGKGDFTLISVFWIKIFTVISFINISRPGLLSKKVKVN